MKLRWLFVLFGASLVHTFGQGTFYFSNFGPGLDAKVFDTDCVTPLSGPGYLADLYWAPGVVTDPNLLRPLGAPATFSTNSARAGYFFGGTRVVFGAVGVITAQVRIWDAADGGSWETARFSPTGRSGISALFQITLADPSKIPPNTPAIMTGLHGTCLQSYICDCFCGYSVDVSVHDQVPQLMISHVCISIGTFSDVPWPTLVTVLASTNLSSWNPIGSLVLTSTFTQFTDYGATNCPQRFYRILGPGWQ